MSLGGILFSNLGTDFLRQNPGAQCKNSDYLCIEYLKADNDNNLHII